jgi:hypothetical protein
MDDLRGHGSMTEIAEQLNVLNKFMRGEQTRNEWVLKTGDTMTGLLTITPSSGTYALRILGTLDAATSIAFYVNVTLKGATSNVGLRFSPVVTVPCGSYYGIDARPVYSNTLAGVLTSFYGLLGIPQISATCDKNVTTVFAGYFRVDNLSAAGSVITSAIGVYIANPGGAGVINNVTGLSIGDITRGSVTNYSIYTSLGAVRFGGKVTCADTIETAAGNEYNFGGYTAGAPVADGYLTMVVDGTTYQVLVNQV